MTYDEMLYRTLTDLGFDLVPVYNCFQPPYDQHTGWPLKLPDVEFTDRTLVLLNFQDFVTAGPTITELDTLERYYQDRSRQVLVVHLSHGVKEYYHGQINLIPFPSHNVITIQELLARKQDWDGKFGVTRDLAWQSLNGRECAHRAKVVKILQSWPRGVLSYGNQIPLADWNYATYRGTENHENFVRLLNVYSRCAINIVTETQYDARPGVISEKTLLAFVAMQIPLIIGHPGAVQDCRDMGFDMFDDLLDTSYDFLPNDQRIERALIGNQQQILGDLDLRDYAPRLLKQQQFVLDHYIDRVQHNFCDQARRLASHLLRSP